MENVADGEPNAAAGTVSLWTKSATARWPLGRSQRDLSHAVEHEVEAFPRRDVHGCHDATRDHDHVPRDRPPPLHRQIGKPRQRSQRIIGAAGGLDLAIAREAPIDTVEVE